jgi:hypothetical protein
MLTYRQYLSCSGRTPLHCAAASGHFAAVETLLHAGAQPHIRDRYGQLACDLALQANHEAIFALFGSHPTSNSGVHDDSTQSSPGSAAFSVARGSPALVPFQRASSTGGGNFSGGSIRSPRKTAASIKGLQI